MHQSIGLCACLFCLRATALLLAPIDQRLQDACQVGSHIVAAVVIESGIEIWSCTFEVA